MKILLVTRSFSVKASDSVMTHDLAYALRDAGHDVRVLCTEWKGQEKTGVYTVNGIETWWYSQDAPKWLPGSLKTPYKMSQCASSARQHFARQLDNFAPDSVIMFSFAAAYASLITYFKSKPKISLFLMLWDFFPYHHFNIRGINNKTFMQFMAKIESRQLDRFDAIGLMTPRNMDYFQQAYPDVKKPELMITPVWGKLPEPKTDKITLRKKFGLPTHKVICVFGGSLSLGRGIHEILELARESQKSVKKAFFIIIGDGPLRSEIETYINNHGLDNIICPKRLERDAYQNFIAACDIGIVSTASNMPFIAPFPSKTIDYFRNHLAILASVEPTTDYGEILENEIKGGLFSNAGDLTQFKKNLIKMVESEDFRKKMSENGTSYLQQNLAVDKVAKTILKTLGK